MKNFEFEGRLEFRNTDLDVLAVLEYGNDYLDLAELYVHSSRRKYLVPASARLKVKFQEAHWDFLAEQTRRHDDYLAECYRDEARDRKRVAA